MNNNKKSLTSEKTSGIILTEDERRIIENLRRYAEMYPHSELSAVFQVHDAKVKYGTLHISKIRL